jgi:hypothetical protein
VIRKTTVPIALQILLRKTTDEEGVNSMLMGTIAGYKDDRIRLSEEVLGKTIGGHNPQIYG